MPTAAAPMPQPAAPPGPTLVVGISDAKASADRAATIATHSLGSCVGIALYDPAVHVGGMLHYQLPDSAADGDRARERPMMFADTGMEALITMMKRLGADPRRLKAVAAGGAAMLAPNGFEVGRRNIAAARKLLWQHGLLLAGHDVGGNAPRHLFLRLCDGEILVKKQGQTLVLNRGAA